MKIFVHFLQAPLCLALSLFPVLLNAQNSYTVSNAPGSNANFKTLQGAHDSVPAGSILYVMPSASSYGSVVFSKKLTVYGTGYFLGANLAPNTQANTGSVVLNSITFRPGSDNSLIEGLQLSDITTNGQSLSRIDMDSVSNIIVSRCLFVPPGYSYSYYVHMINTTNAIFKQCYMNCAGRGLSSVITLNGVPTGFSGVQFNNNIFDFAAQGWNGFQMLTGYSNGLSADATFTNNTFVAAVWRGTYGNFNYTNNLFVNTLAPTDTYNINDLQLGGANIYNIVTLTNFFPAVGNNLVGANTDSMFVGTQSGYHSTDQKWMVRAGNVAATYGQGGIPDGAFGGANPYKLSGIPAIPYIYSLNVPSQATSPGTVGIQIKARASN